MYILHTCIFSYIHTCVCHTYIQREGERGGGERERERARARTLLIGSCSNEDARLKRQYRAGERVRGKAARICSCLGGLIAETQEEGGQTKEAYIVSKEACLGGLVVETQA